METEKSACQVSENIFIHVFRKLYKRISNVSNENADECRLNASIYVAVYWEP